MPNDRQITGNVGVYHVARELSRLGWNVMLTVRNARGADLYAVSQCETLAHPIQVKAHSAGANDTRLGLSPDALVSPWWVFVVEALSEDPICYVVSLDEMRSLMTRDPGTISGKPEAERAYWFERRYCRPGSDRELTEAREAWARLGNPKAVVAAAGQGGAQVFKNDDAGFIDWRDEHVEGFVLNMPYPSAGDERAYQLRHARLHSAACSFIRGDRNGEKSWTTTGYFKVCAESAEAIHTWVAEHVDTKDDWQVPRCKTCGGDWGGPLR